MRNTTRTYYLKHPENDDETQVCQKMFLNTLSIDEKSVRAALQKRTPSGTVEEDKRGKHDKHKTNTDFENQVIKHILLF